MDVAEVVDAPPGANLLGAKWVFAIKTNPDGSIERFKARLVCQGFKQIEGVDFDETYANTAGKTTVRIFLAMACVGGMKIRQLDVTTAFLYGEVDKDIYMRQPPGHDDGTRRVWKLKKALYGLKQAPRIWQEKLSKTLTDLGFTVSDLDPSLYILKKDGQVLFLLDFVDDMLLTSHSDTLTEWVKDRLCEEYKMTDLGEDQKYIGMWIKRDLEKGEMWVHQGPYILEMLEKYQIPECSLFPDNPLPSDFVLFHNWERLNLPDPRTKEEKDEDPLLDKASHKRYQRMVGALNYSMWLTPQGLMWPLRLISSRRPLRRPGCVT